MAAKVLILADERDSHARVVAASLSRNHGLDSAYWAFDRFPREQLSLGFTNGDLSSLPFAEFENIHSIWWRRPGQVQVSSEIKDERVRRFVTDESAHFLAGLVECLGAPIINHPRFQNAASRKPLQLKTASKVGLKIPKTLLSNDPARIRQFWSELEGRCIYKAFASPPWTAVETRRMTAKDVESLDSAALCPMIVQEEIERFCDVRVNIFGDEVFACKVNPQHPIAEVDSRFDVTAIWEPTHLPSHLVEALLRLMHELQLDYGCIDMRQDTSGEFVFFEINPSGQFLFAEIDTGQALSEAMARLLANRGGQLRDQWLGSEDYQERLARRSTF
jgi:glutathione synthase/RimK-type ligase-like ATP-grasp enzyme